MSAEISISLFMEHGTLHWQLFQLHVPTLQAPFFSSSVSISFSLSRIIVRMLPRFEFRICLGSRFRVRDFSQGFLEEQSQVLSSPEQSPQSKKNVPPTIPFTFSSFLFFNLQSFFFRLFVLASPWKFFKILKSYILWGKKYLYLRFWWLDFTWLDLSWLIKWIIPIWIPDRIELNLTSMK